MRAPLVRRPVRIGALVVLAGLGGCGAGAEVPTALSRTQVQEQLSRPAPANLPAPARRLEAQAGTVLAGSGKDGARQLERLVRELRGTPLVINLWGEWCGPCKRELPIFQRAALRLRGQVVFVGVATLSSRAESEAYLRSEIALPFPSLLDDPGAVNKGTGINSVPKTLFYDRAGRRTVHQGAYSSAGGLLADIERYAS